MQASSSAMTCAAMRAAHTLFDEDPVFVDPYALELTSDEYREMHRQGELREHFGGPRIRSVQGHVLGRGRYAEESLEAAMAEGVGQYVMLGAGLDSFVLRRTDLLERLDVFELDLPATQAYKRERMARLGFVGRSNVEFVGVDLRHTGVDRALAAHRYERERPALFLWLGVVSYLTRAAILSTLASIRSCAAAGSHVIFDYPIEERLLAVAERELAHLVSCATARGGEPRRVKHVPSVLQEDVRGLGFELLEDLGPVELEARYFAGRRDGLRPYAEVRLAHYCVP